MGNIGNILFEYQLYEWSKRRIEKGEGSPEDVMRVLAGKPPWPWSAEDLGLHQVEMERAFLFSGAGPADPQTPGTSMDMNPSAFTV